MWQNTFRQWGGAPPIRDERFLRRGERPIRHQNLYFATATAAESEEAKST